MRGRTDDSSGTCWRFRSWRSWKIYTLGWSWARTTRSIGTEASSGPLFVSAWSSIICQLATMYFNAAFHTPESEEGKFPGACQARDIPLDPLSNLMGEAYHRWHHQHPKAFQRPGLDLPYYPSSCLCSSWACSTGSGAEPALKPTFTSLSRRSSNPVITQTRALSGRRRRRPGNGRAGP